MYGCDHFGYQTGNVEYDILCEDPYTMGYIGAWYFVLFIVLSSMTLMALFVGIIIAAMDLLKQTLYDERDMWKEVDIKRRYYHISVKTVDGLLDVFNELDGNRNGELTFNELKFFFDTLKLDDAESISLIAKVLYRAVC